MVIRMWNSIGIVIAFVGTFIASIIAHELGHILYFQDNLNKTIKVYFKKSNLYVAGIKTPIPFFSIKTGTPIDYNNLTRRELYNACLSGIAVGFFPIILMVFLFSPYILWVSLAYIYGCKKDLSIMYKLWNLNKNGTN